MRLRMKKLILYIGNKNYSSWSFRGWAALKLSGVDCNEIITPLYTLQSTQEISKFSPTGKVPCLQHGDLIVWDTIAIIEYLNEIFPNIGLYPKNQTLRSIARSCIAEIHSGFLSLRSECPMNIKRNKFNNISKEASNDLKRIYEIFDYCKNHSSSNSFLLGDFGAIDIFLTPIISRIVSYDMDQEKHSEYISEILNHKFFKEWEKEAKKETWIIEHAEI